MKKFKIILFSQKVSKKYIILIHNRHRKGSNLEFLFSGKIKAMFVFMQETCNRLIKALDNIADKNETFEVKEILGKYSMDTIASCAFGVDAQVYTNNESDFVKNASNMFKPQTTSKVFKSIMENVPFDIGVYIMRLFNISFNPFQSSIEFFYNVVLDTLKSRQKSGSKRNDLIDLMLDAVKGDISGEKDHNGNETFEKVPIFSVRYSLIHENNIF